MTWRGMEEKRTWVGVHGMGRQGVAVHSMQYDLSLFAQASVLWPDHSKNAERGITSLTSVGQKFAMHYFPKGPSPE